jgi:hypothetical protein
MTAAPSMQESLPRSAFVTREVLSMRNKTNRLEQLFVRILEGNGGAERLW